MAYVRYSTTGFSLCEKVKGEDGRWRERTVVWLGPYQTVAEASEGFAATLREFEATAAREDEYLSSRDGLYDRRGRWQRHQLQKQIDKLRDQLAAVQSFLAREAVTETAT